jgi:hypothetical protein
VVSVTDPYGHILGFLEFQKIKVGLLAVCVYPSPNKAIQWLDKHVPTAKNTQETIEELFLKWSKSYQTMAAPQFIPELLGIITFVS